MKLRKGLRSLVTISARFDPADLSPTQRKSFAKYLATGVIRGAHASAAVAALVRREAKNPTVVLRGGMLEWAYLTHSEAAELHARVAANYMRWRFTHDADHAALCKGPWLTSPFEPFGPHGAWYAAGVSLEGLAYTAMPVPEHEVTLTISTPHQGGKS